MQQSTIIEYKYNQIFITTYLVKALQSVLFQDKALTMTLSSASYPDKQVHTHKKTCMYTRAYTKPLYLKKVEEAVPFNRKTQM